MDVIAVFSVLILGAAEIYSMQELPILPGSKAELRGLYRVFDDIRYEAPGVENAGRVGGNLDTGADLELLSALNARAMKGSSKDFGFCWPKRGPRENGSE